MTLKRRVRCCLLRLWQVLALAMLACICVMVRFVSLHHVRSDPFAGMSYPISSQNPGHKHKGYNVDFPIIPHGVSVAVTAPAVFRFTAASNPERHLAAAECFGVDTSQVRRESAGEVLSEALSEFLTKLGDQPRGLQDLGFEKKHVDALVEGTLPQARVLMLAPNLQMQNVDMTREQLRDLFMASMTY